MTLTAGQLVSGSTTLQILNSSPLPGALALQVNRITRKVAPELQAYNDARLAVYKKYGDPSTDGAQYTLREGEDSEKANAELKELWAAEVPVEFKPLPLSLLEHVEISADLLNHALWLFEEDKE